MPLPNPYGPSAMQRLAQRNAAVANNVKKFTTSLPPMMLQNLTPAMQHSLSQQLANQHMAAHTAQQQALLQQQMAQQIAMYNTHPYATGTSTSLFGNSFGGVPITTASSLPSNYVWITTGTSATSSTSAAATNMYLAQMAMDTAGHEADWNSDVHIADGEERDIYLPDGTRIRVAKDGAYKIEDKDAKVVYRANKMRDFNRYINVSDRLEEFIKFCGDEGVRRGDMLELPLKLFIGWLAIESAKADKEEPPEVELLEPLHRVRAPRCRGCGQHVPQRLRQQRIEFCSTGCFDQYTRQLTAAPVLLLPPPDKMTPL